MFSGKFAHSDPTRMVKSRTKWHWREVASSAAAIPLFLLLLLLNGFYSPSLLLFAAISLSAPRGGALPPFSPSHFVICNLQDCQIALFLFPNFPQGPFPSIVPDSDWRKEMGNISIKEKNQVAFLCFHYFISTELWIKTFWYCDKVWILAKPQTVRSFDQRKTGWVGGKDRGRKRLKEKESQEKCFSHAQSNPARLPPPPHTRTTWAKGGTLTYYNLNLFYRPSRKGGKETPSCRQEIPQRALPPPPPPVCLLPPSLLLSRHFWTRRDEGTDTADERRRQTGNQTWGRRWDRP